MKKIFGILIFSSLVFSGEPDPRLLVHVLNYIAVDYAGAVSPQGEVKSNFEYEEQRDFAQRAKELSREITGLNFPEIRVAIDQLEKLVTEKADPTKVAAKSQEISQLIIQKSHLATSPVHKVNLENGKTLYDQNCFQCHGVSGMGDGPSSGNFNPPPTNFQGPKLNGTSNFQLFNTIKLGVPGTAMAAFDHLSDSEIWDLAFYVDSLRKTSIVSKAVEALDQAVQSFEKGDFKSAKTFAIEAYLDGVEPLEPKLRLKDLAFTNELEQSLLKIRQGIDRQVPVTELGQSVEATKALLAQVEKVLSRKESSHWFTFSVAFGIFMREAFESALLLITLLGVIRSFGSPRAALFVHAGWGLAVILGLVGWFFSGWIMSVTGAQRELLEGAVALLAVAMLLYFGFWMHRKTEIGRWREFIKQMVSMALQKKNLFALGTVAFMGVFREVFETVVFLRALLLESGAQHELTLGAGVLTAFVLVVLLSWWSVRWSAKIPVRQLFVISSWVMFFLSFVLLGKGIHALQETGLVSVTSIGLDWKIELLGVYPFYQTLVPQLLLTALIFFWWWSGKRPVSSLNLINARRTTESAG
jgi:high-affinity iron transporter